MIKYCLVANSSSCSFILLHKNKLTKEKIIKTLENSKLNVNGLIADFILKRYETYNRNDINLEENEQDDFWLENNVLKELKENPDFSLSKFDCSSESGDALEMFLYELPERTIKSSDLIIFKEGN
jgi:hypothetical protein